VNAAILPGGVIRGPSEVSGTANAIRYAQGARWSAAARVGQIQKLSIDSFFVKGDNVRVDTGTCRHRMKYLLVG
jgi:hypothetical protein